jgi:predicted CoA-binding protein
VTDPRAVLEAAKTIAVVGLSTMPHKAAHRIPAQLKERGFRVIPVHPYADEILGEPAYRTIGEVPEPVDLVIVFRPPGQAGEIVRQAVEAGAPRVWLQLGITSEEGRRIAGEAGVDYVEDRCAGVDAARWDIRK